MKEKTLIEKLLWLKEQGVKIKWERKKSLQELLKNTSSSIRKRHRDIGSFTIKPYLEPTAKTELILYINSDIEAVTTDVNNCYLDQLKYLEFLKSMEDTPEVLTLKADFENACK